MLEVGFLLTLGGSGRGVDEDPVALAESILVLVGVLDGCGAEGALVVLAGENREEVVAVDGFLVVDFVASDLGEGGGEVDLADDFSLAGTCFDFAGPADDEGDAVAAFIDVSF